jgi:DNA mismatch repair protein MutH
MPTSPPKTEQELLERCHAIAGLSVAELAAQLNIPVADNLKTHKGWLGELVELALGADAASTSRPDFVELGIELKTLPVDPQGRVMESTWVCSVPMQQASGILWQDSCVYHKLHHVLWLPVEASPEVPLARRHIGTALLWRASTDILEQLRADWEELMEYVALGRLEELSARHGELLQIRPKAANARALGETTGIDGQPAQTLPRGFYLRSEFTNEMLKAHYGHSRTLPKIDK